MMPYMDELVDYMHVMLPYAKANYEVLLPYMDELGKIFVIHILNV